MLHQCYKFTKMGGVIFINDYYGILGTCFCRGGTHHGKSPSRHKTRNILETKELNSFRIIHIRRCKSDACNGAKKV